MGLTACDLPDHIWFTIDGCIRFHRMEGWKDPMKIPIIPVHIFKHRSILAVLVCFFIHGIIGVAPYYYLPLFFQTVRSATPTLSGVYILSMVLASSFASIFTGIFTKVTGRVVEPMLLGFALSTLGLWLFINLNEQSSCAKLIVYQLIYGIGLGPNYIAPILGLCGPKTLLLRHLP